MIADYASNCYTRHMSENLDRWMVALRIGNGVLLAVSSSHRRYGVHSRADIFVGGDLSWRDTQCLRRQVHSRYFANHGSFDSGMDCLLCHIHSGSRPHSHFLSQHLQHGVVYKSPDDSVLSDFLFPTHLPTNPAHHEPDINRWLASWDPRTSSHWLGTEHASSD